MGFKQGEVEELLVQTGRRCCLCGELHIIQVHHIVPLEKGGTDEIDNAIPLCANCHEKVHKSLGSSGMTRVYTANELKLHRTRAIERTRQPGPIDQQADIDDRLEELIKILQIRAAAIERELQLHYKNDVGDCLVEFLSLHNEHIVALRQRNFLLAHEILREINALSYSLETSEAALLKRHGVDYAMLSDDHYRKGALICGYVAGDHRKKSVLYPGESILNWVDPSFVKPAGAPADIEDLYFRVFRAARPKMHD